MQNNQDNNTQHTIVFGTDGIRGEVGIHPITPDFFLKLGWAVGCVLRQEFENPSVIIGKDTRISGYLFESSLEAGLLSAGVDVGLLGPMPTPAIAYLTATYGASSGAVISASHNSWTDNGVKFFGSSGAKISDAMQEQITHYLQQEIVIDSKKVGKARRYEQAVGRYIEFCKASFNRKFSLQHLTIVLDVAHGATYHIAGSVFRELGANVITTNNTPDGVNINYQCGATHTKHLQNEVLKHNADIGIAYDGDGDRVIMVDHQGKQVDGDELLFIIANYYKQQDILNNNCVVGTQMTNLGVRNSLKTLGVRFIEAKVGDRFVMEQMQHNDSILGGEGSGHIICSHHTTTGDGIIASLQVIEAMLSSGESLYSLKKHTTKYPQVLHNVTFSDNFSIEDKNLQHKKLELEQQLGDNGRILIRKSGTENLIRIMVETTDETVANEYAHTLSKYIQ
jgi:phosphoglucosamine mutase